MNFTFNDLSQPLARVISELGFEKPTDIQQLAIPMLLAEETDFVGQAQTGTGKTAAFTLPLLERINTDLLEIQAVILSPTRELANQINEEIKRFSKYLKINTAIVYGGVGYRDQIDSLRKAQIVIATPGRALDLLDRGKLDIRSAKYFIIDEADEMLKMGFIEDVETLIEQTPADTLKWMFSATMPRSIIQLMEQKLNAPKIIRIEKKTLSNENVKQSYCRLPKKDFTKALKVILLTEKEFYGIVFCETREETKNLADKISNFGKRVVALHGDLNQNQRDAAMEKFKSRRADVMVCTDVASRGLDVADVTHVINMGLPRKTDSYVHRIGRTGRAGQTGKAISFVTPTETRNLKIIERTIKHRIETYDVPSPKKTKEGIVSTELLRMQGLKEAISSRDDFKLDESFAVYQDFLKDMDKAKLLKLMFSYQFNSDFRQIDESLTNLKNSMSAKEESPRRSERNRRSRSDRPRRSRNNSGPRRRRNFR